MIETSGQISEAESYNKVIIKEAAGFPLRVENIGQALDGLDDRYPYFHYVSKDVDKSVVVLAVSRLPGSNTLKISESIFKQLPELKRSLPHSVDLFIFYDYATSILSAVKDVQWSLIIALALVVFVIFLYLGKFFDTIVPSLVLPMSMLATFIAMYWMGFTLDSLSLLALTLAIGFIIDDAIVVQENIVRHAEGGSSPYESALNGSRQISLTVFTMTLALSAVFIPMIWMPGILGRIFHEFSLTIVVAIFCSGFIALTLNPMLCSRFLKTRDSQSMNRLERFSKEKNEWLLRHYERLLKGSFFYKKTVLLIGFSCLLFSFVLLKILPTDFIPAGNISLIEGLTQAAEGSSNRNTIQHQIDVNEVLRKNPYIEGFIAIAGYPMSDQGVLYARLVDPEKRPSSSQVSRDLTASTFLVPGMVSYTRPVPLINLQVGNSGSLGDYQYTLSSTDSSLLYKAAETFTEEMRKIPEIVGVNNDLRIKSPELKVAIDRDRASHYGLSAEEIESTLLFAYSGRRIATFNKSSNLYNLILEIDPHYDLTEKDLDLLFIKSKATNRLVPLSEVASWQEIAAASSINHINIFPSVTISFSLAEKASLGPVLKKLEKLSKESLPETVIGTVQGSAQVFLETFKSMTWLIVISILVIYLLLGILYESFIHPLTILSALPVAVFGGLLTLWIFKEPLSLYSVVGLIVLIGLVQKNGIMMIDFALEQMRLQNASPENAVLEACKERFRPILMTTLAAMMGALPVAIGIGDNGQTNRPLGLVVLGGLLFSQLLTLFVTPIVFLYMERGKQWFSQKKASS